MTYQFSAKAWNPPTKATIQVPALNPGDLAETLADVLIAPARGIWRKPNPQTALEMLAQLEDQAREIVELAAGAETLAPFRTFTAYRVFREKLCDFQSFCGVIEGQLARLAGERRQEFEERFYALWAAIYRPAIKALSGFFAVISRDGVMPLGAREMLESEMLALESMKSILADPRFESVRNEELIATIATLIKTVGGLADRASSLPELVDTRKPVVRPTPPRPTPAPNAKRRAA